MKAKVCMRFHPEIFFKNKIMTTIWVKIKMSPLITKENELEN